MQELCQHNKDGRQHDQVRCYKNNFMLNSAGYEISNAHKYKKNQEIQHFQAQVSLEYYFCCSSMLKCQQLLAF